jgi:hypothetical protein
MKKMYFMVSVALIMVVLGTCLSCKGSESKSEANNNAVTSSESESKSSLDAEIGNVSNESSNELTADLSVKGVETKVENKTENKIEAPVTAWEFLKSISESWFWRSILIVYSLMWFTGNLHPSKNFSLRDKKS